MRVHAELNLLIFANHLQLTFGSEESSDFKSGSKATGVKEHIAGESRKPQSNKGSQQHQRIVTKHKKKNKEKRKQKRVYTI